MRWLAHAGITRRTRLPSRPYTHQVNCRYAAHLSDLQICITLCSGFMGGHRAVGKMVRGSVTGRGQWREEGIRLVHSPLDSNWHTVDTHCLVGYTIDLQLWPMVWQSHLEFWWCHNVINNGRRSRRRNAAVFFYRFVGGSRRQLSTRTWFSAISTFLSTVVSMHRSSNAVFLITHLGPSSSSSSETHPVVQNQTAKLSYRPL